MAKVAGVGQKIGPFARSRQPCRLQTPEAGPGSHAATGKHARPMHAPLPRRPAARGVTDQPERTDDGRSFAPSDLICPVTKARRSGTAGLADGQDSGQNPCPGYDGRIVDDPDKRPGRRVPTRQGNRRQPGAAKQRLGNAVETDKRHILRDPRQETAVVTVLYQTLGAGRHYSRCRLA